MSSIHSHSQSNSVPSSKEKGKMRLSYSLARRIHHDTDRGKQVSCPTILVTMIGIAIDLAVMIIAVSVVIGFKGGVRNKMVGFGLHIQVSNFDMAGSYETHLVVVDDSMMIALSAHPEARYVQRYSTKPGIIKTGDAFQGMVLEGVGPEFDSAFFRDHLVEGEVPIFSDTASTNQVIISKAIADWLRPELGDKMCIYFIQKDAHTRRSTVKDIYQTSFSEYDNPFLLVDLYLMNCSNNWTPEQVSGAELQVRDYDRLEDITYGIAVDTDNKQGVHKGTHYAQNIGRMNPQIFAWLGLLGLNVWVILILMIGIAGFTMISGLLIVILERTRMIGILKALGASDLTIRKIFLWLSVFLIGRGMLRGNAIGITFCVLQSQLGPFKLDPETHYVDMVPVPMNIWLLPLINAGTLLASVLILVGPSYLIAEINLTSSMRYEWSSHPHIRSPSL